MLLILIAIIVSAAIGFALIAYSGDGYSGTHGLALLVGIAMLFGAGIASISYAFAGWSWLASDTKAQIINREYGTNYTREEVFYASDVIDTIREIDRKRVEVNGDLFREQKDAK